MQQPWFLGCAMMSFRCCPKTLYGCSVRAGSQRPASCERHRAWHQARRGGRTFEARARAEAQEALHEEQLHGLGPRHDVLHEGLESGAATLEELLRRGAGRLGADALGREPGELQPRARLLDLPRARHLRRSAAHSRRRAAHRLHGIGIDRCGRALVMSVWKLL